MRRQFWLNALVRGLPIPLGLLLSGLLVWQASYAVFSSTVSNTGNKFSAGSVGDLTDDSNGVPLFRVVNIVPGATGVNCMKVTSTGTVPAALKIYTSMTSPPTNDISAYLDIVAEVGTGGVFGNCASFAPAATIFTGTLATLTTTHTNYANGIGPFPTTGIPPEIFSFRVTWTFNAAAPSSTQNGNTPDIAITLEAQHA